MGALIAYLVAMTLAIGVALANTVRRPRGVRDPGWDLNDHSRKLVGMATSLAGFAVTGLVLLVTLGRNVPAGMTHDSLTAVLLMFVVAFMSYVAAGLMLANLTPHRDGLSFDVQGTQYAVAAIAFWEAIIVGWLALRPLLVAFGQVTVADIVSWFLLAAAIGGWLIVASALYRTGFGPRIVLAMLPVVTLVSTLVFAGLGSVTGSAIRSASDVELFAVVGFVLGFLAVGTFTLLPVVAEFAWATRLLASRVHLFVIGYAQAVAVYVGFFVVTIVAPV